MNYVANWISGNRTDSIAHFRLFWNTTGFQMIVRNFDVNKVSYMFCPFRGSSRLDGNFLFPSTFLTRIISERKQSPCVTLRTPERNADFMMTGWKKMIDWALCANLIVKHSFFCHSNILICATFFAQMHGIDKEFWIIFSYPFGLLWISLFIN